jgi:hypothetical protein
MLIFCSVSPAVSRAVDEDPLQQYIDECMTYYLLEQVCWMFLLYKMACRLQGKAYAGLRVFIYSVTNIQFSSCAL